jgi:hypothetical protein
MPSTEFDFLGLSGSKGKDSDVRWGHFDLFVKLIVLISIVTKITTKFYTSFQSENSSKEDPKMEIKIKFIFDAFKDRFNHEETSTLYIDIKSIKRFRFTIFFTGFAHDVQIDFP